MSKPRKRRLLAAVAAAIICVSTVATPSPASAAAPIRADGANRYDTARIVSLTLNQCSVAIANGEDFPDGLAGAVFGMPVLLTKMASLPPETVLELNRLDTLCPGGLDNVFVLGGQGVVSATVFQNLAITYAPNQLIRLSGADRYGTALAIAQYVHDNGGINDNRVFLATGTDFPDALAAGSPSGLWRQPIILNDGDSLRPEVADFLLDKGIQDVVILGGTAAVPATVEDEIQSHGINTTRGAGANRFETAKAIAEGVFMGPDCAILVNGNAFPDALAAGPLGAAFICPIMLVNRDDVPTPTSAWLEANDTSLATIAAIGGTGVISNATLVAATDAATP